MEGLSNAVHYFDRCAPRADKANNLHPIERYLDALLGIISERREKVHLNGVFSILSACRTAKIIKPLEHERATADLIDVLDNWVSADFRRGEAIGESRHFNFFVSG